MALSMKSYTVLQEHIEKIHKADAEYAKHMWDEDNEEFLNAFIEALADLATEVEYFILETEMPIEEKAKQERLAYEESLK